MPAFRALAIAAALGLAAAGAARAQLKIERIGAWDHVLAVKENIAFFVVATPNDAAARAYCAWETLHGSPYAEPLNADPAVQKAGTSPGFACIRLGCAPQGHRGDAELTLFANAALLAEEKVPPGGISIRMRLGAAAPAVLFERAKQLDRSRDDTLELLVWGVRPPRDSAETGTVQAAVTLAASQAFLDRLAAAQQVAFELSPWGRMRYGPKGAHAGRTAAFSLAGMADMLAAQRKHCAAKPRR